MSVLVDKPAALKVDAYDECERYRFVLPAAPVVPEADIVALSVLFGFLGDPPDDTMSVMPPQRPRETAVGDPSAQCDAVTVFSLDRHNAVSLVRRQDEKKDGQPAGGGSVLALRGASPSVQRWVMTHGMRVSVFRPLDAWPPRHLKNSVDHGADHQPDLFVTTPPVKSRRKERQAYNLDTWSAVQEGWVGCNVDWETGIAKGDGMQGVLRQHNFLDYVAAISWLIESMWRPGQEDGAVGGQASLLRRENLDLQNQNAELRILVEILRTALDAKKRQLEESEQGSLMVREERLMEGVQLQLVMDENSRLEDELDISSERERAATATVAHLEKQLKVR